MFSYKPYPKSKSPTVQRLHSQLALTILFFPLFFITNLTNVWNMLTASPKLNCHRPYRDSTILEQAHVSKINNAHQPRHISSSSTSHVAISCCTMQAAIPVLILPLSLAIKYHPPEKREVDNTIWHITQCITTIAESDQDTDAKQRLNNPWIHCNEGSHKTLEPDQFLFPHQTIHITLSVVVPLFTLLYLSFFFSFSTPA